MPITLWPKNTPSKHQLDKVYQIDYTFRKEEGRVSVYAFNRLERPKDPRDRWCTIPTRIHPTVLQTVWIRACLSEMWNRNQREASGCLKVYMKYYDSLVDEIWNEAERGGDGGVPEVLQTWMDEEVYFGSHIPRQHRADPPADHAELIKVLLTRFPSAKLLVSGEKLWDEVQVQDKREIWREVRKWLAKEEESMRPNLNSDPKSKGKGKEKASESGNSREVPTSTTTASLIPRTNLGPEARERALSNMNPVDLPRWEILPEPSEASVEDSEDEDMDEDMDDQIRATPAPTMPPTRTRGVPSTFPPSSNSGPGTGIGNGSGDSRPAQKRKESGEGAGAAGGYNGGGGQPEPFPKRARREQPGLVLGGGGGGSGSGNGVATAGPSKPPLPNAHTQTHTHAGSLAGPRVQGSMQPPPLPSRAQPLSTSSSQPPPSSRSSSGTGTGTSRHGHVGMNAAGPSSSQPSSSSAGLSTQVTSTSKQRLLSTTHSSASAPTSTSAGTSKQSKLAFGARRDTNDSDIPSTLVPSLFAAANAKKQSASSGTGTGTGTTTATATATTAASTTTTTSHARSIQAQLQAQTQPPSKSKSSITSTSTAKSSSASASNASGSKHKPPPDDIIEISSDDDDLPPPPPSRASLSKGKGREKERETDKPRSSTSAARPSNVARKKTGGKPPVLSGAEAAQVRAKAKARRKSEAKAAAAAGVVQAPFETIDISDSGDDEVLAATAAPVPTSAAAGEGKKQAVAGPSSAPAPSTSIPIPIPTPKAPRPALPKYTPSPPAAETAAGPSTALQKTAPPVPLITKPTAGPSNALPMTAPPVPLTTKPAAGPGPSSVSSKVVLNERTVAPVDDVDDRMDVDPVPPRATTTTAAADEVQDHVMGSSEDEEDVEMAPVPSAEGPSSAKAASTSTSTSAPAFASAAPLTSNHGTNAISAPTTTDAPSARRRPQVEVARKSAGQKGNPQVQLPLPAFPIALSVSRSGSGSSSTSTSTSTSSADTSSSGTTGSDSGNAMADRILAALPPVEARETTQDKGKGKDRDVASEDEIDMRDLDAALGLDLPSLSALAKGKGKAREVTPPRTSVKQQPISPELPEGSSSRPHARKSMGGRGPRTLAQAISSAGRINTAIHQKLKFKGNSMDDAIDLTSDLSGDDEGGKGKAPQAAPRNAPTNKLVESSKRLVQELKKAQSPGSVTAPSAGLPAIESRSASSRFSTDELALRTGPTSSPSPAESSSPALDSSVPPDSAVEPEPSESPRPPSSRPSPVVGQSSSKADRPAESRRLSAPSFSAKASSPPKPQSLLARSATNPPQTSAAPVGPSSGGEPTTRPPARPFTAASAPQLQIAVDEVNVQAQKLDTASRPRSPLSRAFSPPQSIEARISAPLSPRGPQGAFVRAEPPKSTSVAGTAAAVVAKGLEASVEHESVVVRRTVVQKVSTTTTVTSFPSTSNLPKDIEMAASKTTPEDETARELEEVTAMIDASNSSTDEGLLAVENDSMAVDSEPEASVPSIILSSQSTIKVSRRRSRKIIRDSPDAFGRDTSSEGAGPSRSRSQSSPEPLPSSSKRRSSRLSSHSTASEDVRLNVFDEDTGAVQSVPSSRSTTPEDHTVAIRSGTLGGFPAFRFETYRKDPKNFPRVYYASEIPSALQDHMNRLGDPSRKHSNLRKVYEGMILENTSSDEPNAPPILIENDVDDDPTPPWEFYYTNMMWHGDGVPPPDSTNLKKCDCRGACNPRSKSCACAIRHQEMTKDFQGHSGDFAYDKNGKLKVFGFLIFECNNMCSCSSECSNRVVQHGRKIQLSIRKTVNKGWGVFNGPQKISAGTFIGIYSGELLTDKVAHNRGLKYNKAGTTYLFDIDFWNCKESREDKNNLYTVDAYHAGNFTRFLNHSCDPNCRIDPCYINDADVQKPLLAIFSIRDVEPEEEVCFSYTGIYPGEDDDDEEEEEEEEADGEKAADTIYKVCMCGAYNCSGTALFRS